MSTRRVVIVAFPGVQPLDAVGPAEVFHTAARLRPGAYEVMIAAPEREPLRASAVTLMPDAAAGSLRGPVDTLVMAGGLGVPALEQRPDLPVDAAPGGRAIAAHGGRVHGSVRPRRRRPARRPPGHHALGELRAAGRALPGRVRGPRPDLRPRRRRVHLGRRDRRYGPGPRARGGGPRPRGGAGDGPLARALREAARRPGPVQRPAHGADRRAPAAPRAPVMDRRPPGRGPERSRRWPPAPT